MIIDELRETVAGEPCQDLRDLLPGQRALLDLADEILALVEAANMIRAAQGQYIDTDGHPGGYKLLAALDAFNAKLESLRA